MASLLQWKYNLIFSSADCFPTKDIHRFVDLCLCVPVENVGQPVGITCCDYHSGYPVGSKGVAKIVTLSWACCIFHMRIDLII